MDLLIVDDEKHAREALEDFLSERFSITLAADGQEALEKLQKKLDSLGHSDLVLLVTHQVVILEQTGLAPKSGEMVLYNSLTKKTGRYMVDY